MVRRNHALLIIVTACLLVFARVCSFEFQALDDAVNVVFNPHLHPLSLNGIRFFWTTTCNHLYIPMTYTVWMGIGIVAAWLKAGVSEAAIFHAANLVLHVCNSCLVFYLLKDLLGKRAMLAALLGSLLFALHPIQVESVAWVTGMKDMLGCLFGLGCLIVSLRFVSRGSVRLYLAGFALFILAVLSKPSMVTLPAIVLLVSITLYGRDWRWALKTFGPWLVPSIAVVWATTSAQPDSYLAYVAPLWLRPFEMLANLALYMGGIVFFQLPSNVYYRPIGMFHVHSWFWCLALFGLLTTSVAWWGGRRHKPFLAGVLIFLGGLVVVSGIMSFNYQHNSDTTDHYCYFAMAGVALAFATVVHAWRSVVTGILAGCFLIACVVQTTLQLPVWRSSVTHARALLAHNMGNAILERDLGVALSITNAAEEGLGHLREARRLAPDQMIHRKNIETALALLGRPSELETEYRAHLLADPDDAELSFELGNLLVLEGKSDEGVAELQRAALRDSSLLKKRYALGEYLVNTYPQFHDRGPLVDKASLRYPQAESLVMLSVIVARPAQARAVRPFFIYGFER